MNRLTRNDLITMAKKADARANEIESMHNIKIKKLNAEYKGKELEKKISEENKIYYNNKLENDRKTKLEIEDIQHKLLNEIKSQYISEQKKIMKEYNEFETNSKEIFKIKEEANLRTYQQQLDMLVNKYNKKLNNKNKNKQKFIELEPIKIENILKLAKINNCKKLTDLDIEYHKSKKQLNNEYKKTKDRWSTGEENIYETVKELELEYNLRCYRYRYKYNIEKYYHINKCQECKTENFLYCNEEKLYEYFHEHKNIKVDKSEIIEEFIKTFISIFIEYYDSEITRIQEYELLVPKEQNIIYTVLYAEKIWTKIKSLKILDLKFNNKSDDEKIEQFRKEEDKFYKDFPIVARYMICADTYNRIAFKKFLTKLINSNEKKQNRTNKTDAENEWIELQADYVKYLYQEYNKSKHLSSKELQNIWKETYELLKNEFSSFKDLYDKKIKQIEEDKKIQNAEIAKDLLNRLTSIQSIDNDTQYKLYIEMQNTLFLQRSNKNLKELLKRKIYIEPVKEGNGKNNEGIMEMERDKKMKEAKSKFSPEAQIKNPVKYYYDNLEPNMDEHMFKELRNLRYLQDYRDVLYELFICHQYLKHMKKEQIIEGYGTNEEQLMKWKEEQQKWIDDHYGSSTKIHVPYTRNLVKMYYDNDERFEI
jgi:hypothetical protein